MASISSSIAAFFSNPLSADREAYVSANYPVVVKEVAHRINGKYRLGHAVSSDIATVATLFGIVGVFSGKTGVPASAEELLAASLWKAHNLAKDECRARAKGREALLLDNPFVNDSVGGSDQNRVINDASLKAWHDHEANSLWDEMLSVTRRAMRRFLVQNFSKRTSAIFWARSLDLVPMGDVCRAFHTNPDCVSVTCHRVMKLWKREGRSYYGVAA